VPAQPARRHEHTINVAHRAVEGELAKECGTGWRPPAHDSQRDRDGDWKVEPAALLSQLSRREIYGEPSMGKLQAAVADPGPDAFASLLDRCRSETNK